MSGWAPFCGCFNDLPSCCLSYFLPCVQFGFNAQAMGDDCCLCCLVYVVSWHFGACCIPHGMLREKIRAKNGLPAEPCNDYCVTCFLPCCSLSQEARTIGAGGGGPGRQTMA